MARGHPDIDLSSRTAIVTGGSRGIGRAIALALAQAGANVVVAARTVEESPTLPGTIHKTAQEIIESGGSALALQCDVTSARDVAAMVEKTLDTYGTIDILVNNAGVLVLNPLEKITEAEWDVHMDINVKGAYLFCQAALPGMNRRGWGRIINIASSAGQRGLGTGCPYPAAKPPLGG